MKPRRNLRIYAYLLAAWIVLLVLQHFAHQDGVEKARGFGGLRRSCAWLLGGPASILPPSCASAREEPDRTR